MRRIAFTILPYLVFSLTSFSQDSTGSRTGQLSGSSLGSPLIVIHGEEIRRFPSTNFLDAVNGLFPWVFSETPSTNDFVFVVDGYLMEDINALSLYDIDEVTFTRNSLNGQLYPFSKAGTFFVKTKTHLPGKSQVDFQSQYNVAWNNDRHALTDPTYPSPSVQDHLNNSTGGLMLNHISARAGGTKWHLYGAAQLGLLTDPQLEQQRMTAYPGFTPDTTTARMSSRQTNAGAFVNMQYEVMKTLTVAVTGNYFHGQTNGSYSQIGRATTNGTYGQTQTSTMPLQNYHVGSTIKWSPLTRLENRFTFEYTDNDLHYKSPGLEKFFVADTLNQTINEINTVKVLDKSYLLRDELTYDVPVSKKIIIGGSAVFSYVHSNIDHESTTVQTTGGLGSNSSWYISKYKQKLTTLDPGIHFTYGDVLKGYAGYNFFLNKGSSRYTRSSRTNPYAGIAIDLKNALGLHSVSRLDISFDYGDLPQSAGSRYFLPASDPQLLVPGTVIYGTGQPVIIPNPSLQYVIEKNRLIGLQANAGFFNGRLLVGSEWTKLDLQRLYLVAVPVGGNNNGLMWVLGKETQTGVSIFSEGKLISTTRITWNTRVSFLVPHISRHLSGLLPSMYIPSNYSYQAGLQNRIRVDHFAVQLNIVYGQNRTYVVTDNFGTSHTNHFNEFSLSNFLVSYDLASSPNRFMKNVSIFLQARNLISSKTARDYYQYNSYGGGGIELKLR